MAKAVPGNGPVKASVAKTLYLTLYNFASAVLWATVLGRTIGTLYLRGYDFVPLTTGVFVRNTQTLALLEVVHSATGIVRAPVFTTIMQVASRLLLVWGVAYPFPGVAYSTPFFSSMLLAWSLTEVIRYFYFALGLARANASGPSVPDWFTRLRYSTFLVLYPIGIASEVRLVYLAAVVPDAAAMLHPYLPYAFYAVLAIYVPGSYILYTYMLAQRRKVMKKLKADSAKAQ